MFSKFSNLILASIVLTISAIFLPSVSAQTVIQSPVTLNPGDTLELTVTADGTQPFSYQWAKDGTSLLNATTSKLLLSNVTEKTAGNYSATVKNSAGQDLTPPFTIAILIVKPGNSRIGAVIIAKPAAVTKP